MKKTIIYLDTSIINFLYADDNPELKDKTISFFEDYVKNDIFDVVISPVVIDEINKTTDETHKTKLLSVIETYNLSVIDISEKLSDIERLAEIYIERGIIPKKKIEDALHIAIVTIFEIDILLSWNYKHLANFNKEMKITSANLSEGYIKSFKMITPYGVLYEDEE